MVSGVQSLSGTFLPGLPRRKDRNCFQRKSIQACESTSVSESRKGRVGLHQPEVLSLKSLTYSDLEDWCQSIDEKPRRAQQLWKWMYHEGRFLENLHDTKGKQDGFSGAFIDKVQNLATVEGGLRLIDVHQSLDGTQKLVFEVGNDGSRVETVLIPVSRGNRERITVCVSSQIGCAMNCQFCYTGTMGLKTNLSTAQIVEQVVVARRLIAQQRGDTTGSPSPITNVVFMGMGEPFNNLSAVLPACEILTDPRGLQFSPAKVTVSTVGLVPQIREFMTESSCELAVSLHAPTDEIRNFIVPVNRRHSLSSLISVLEEFFPRNGPRSVCLEYVMLKGVNDSLQNAQELLDLTERLECTYNLIEFNPYKGALFSPSTQETINEFRKVLVEENRVAPIRCSRGQDEMAACGQLGNAGGSSV
ncbi:hypothetical protein BSKO_09687 [Bryopsis sp. KO-2023]|nr:hypothetical protein BSKO_09687 [Bryopsis sp. KO-2023]